jgi:hypothetical protein
MGVVNLPKVEVVTWAVYQPGQFSPVAWVEASSYEVDAETHILTFHRDGKVQSVWHSWCHIERQEESH